MSTPQLNLAHITATQSNKEVTANLSADGLDNAMNAVLQLSVTGSRVLTAAQFRGAHAIKMNGTPAASFTLAIPSGIAHFFGIHNYTNRTCFVEIASDRSGAVAIPSGGSRALYSTGTEIYLYEGSSVSVPYDLAAFVPGKPLDDEAVFRFVAVRSITLATAFAGCYAKALAVATGDVYFSIQKNSTVIGAIRFNASLTGVFSTAGPGPGGLVAGDILSIYAPPYRDNTLRDIAISLAATVA